MGPNESSQIRNLKFYDENGNLIGQLDQAESIMKIEPEIIKVEIRMDLLKKYYGIG